MTQNSAYYNNYSNTNYTHKIIHTDKKKSWNYPTCVLMNARAHVHLWCASSGSAFTFDPAEVLWDLYSLCHACLRLLVTMVCSLLLSRVLFSRAGTLGPLLTWPLFSRAEGYLGSLVTLQCNNEETCLAAYSCSLNLDCMANIAFDPGVQRFDTT